MQFAFKGGGEKQQGCFGKLKVESSRGQRNIFCPTLTGETRLTIFPSGKKWGRDRVHSDESHAKTDLL